MGANKKLCAGAGAYLLIAIIAFGPAMVESMEAENARYTRCTQNTKGYCFQPDAGMAALGSSLKAGLWPFWLSYQAAKYRTHDTGDGHE